jgi:hypothetical protein
VVRWGGGVGWSQTLGTAFLDDFVSWRNLTIIWITRSALEPTAQVAFSQSDQAFLTELGITMLHVRYVKTRCRPG